MKHALFFTSILLLSACDQKVDNSVYVLTKDDSAKLDLTSYPEIRKEVTEYMHATAPDKTVTAEMFEGCSEDVVAVGPDGRRSIGGIKWKKNFEKEAVTFKKVVIVPGTEIIRLYNEGKTAVRSVLINVTLGTPIGEVNLDVMRSETYIKKGNQWCMVAGQGTEPYASFIGKLIAKYGYPVIAFVLGLMTMWLFGKFKSKKTPS
jgi:hypothetical protein